jgi:8-hydroxy-5-deazaflavin:NADPH oxidoreductase
MLKSLSITNNSFQVMINFSHLSKFISYLKFSLHFKRSTFMKIAIIGTGNMAVGLASVWAAAGHAISIGARDLTKAAALAEKVGHNSVGDAIAVAAERADIVVLAVPFEAAADAIQQAGNLSGKVLVDISNPISLDYKELTIGHTTSAAEEIQKLAPQALVVKAFNTIFAQLLAPDARTGKTLQVFIAGDAATAKATVSDLVTSAGFEPVDAGLLSNSRYLEPIGEMNIHFGFFLGKGPVVAPAWVQV